MGFLGFWGTIRACQEEKGLCFYGYLHQGRRVVSLQQKKEYFGALVLRKENRKMDVLDEAESNMEVIYTFLLQHGRATIDDILVAVEISPSGAYEAAKLLEKQGRLNIVYDKGNPCRIEYVEAKA